MISVNVESRLPKAAREELRRLRAELEEARGAQRVKGVRAVEIVVDGVMFIVRRDNDRLTIRCNEGTLSVRPRLSNEIEVLSCT